MRVLFFAPLLFSLACSRPRDPHAVFDHALQTFRQGKISDAEREAKEGYQRFHNLSAEWAWKFRILEANAVAWRGLNDQVLTLLGTEPTPLPSGELTVQRKRLESVAYAAKGKFQEAEQRLGEAEQACAGSETPACASVVIDRGEVELGRGLFAHAQGLFEHALGLSRARGDTFLEATALLALSHSALQQEHYDEAIDSANLSYRFSSAHHYADIAQNSLGNLGWAYYKLGEPDRAEKLFVDAEGQATQLGDVTDEVKWLTTLGYVYLDALEYDQAEQNYHRALDLARHTTTQDVTDALMSLALVSERTGKLDQARDYADKTIALVPADGDPLDRLYPMLVKGHVAARLHNTDEAEKTFREIEQHPKSHVFLKWEAEHSLAQLYEDESKPDLADREYRAALSTFETARSSLKKEESSLPFPANAAGIYDDYIHFLVSKGKAAEALQVAEYQRGRTLAEGLGFLQKGTTFKLEPTNAQATALKVGGTILFYSLGEKQSYLWAITPQETCMFPLPPKSEINPKVQRYRKALANQEEFLADADGRALYGTLVAPVQALLPKDGEVFVIPDGDLNTLNFETLLVPGATPEVAPHYWIDDVTIADASSLHLLAAARGPQRLKPQPDARPSSTALSRALPVRGIAAGNRSGSLLLLGDAISPSADYPQLLKASEEMQSIEKHFAPEQQQVFGREQATPAAYANGKPEQFSYIHFVAHGTASRTSPLDSAIVLSKASAQDDSFKLYARDIIHHPLHAELVTISTCYGAGERAYSGEGLVGLSWAFLRAGAHNVVGALWEVSDVSTPKLMDGFYDGLQNGKSPDAALRAAKLSLLHSGNDFRKPFYWAPFQLYTGS